MRTEDPTKAWTVVTSFKPNPPDPHYTMGVITLRYESKTIKTEPICFQRHPNIDPEEILPDDGWEADGVKVKHYEAMAAGFNERDWKPTFSHVVIACARILADAMEGKRYRKISHIRRYRGNISVTVHAGTIFIFTDELALLSCDCAEFGVRVEFNDSEQKLFSEHVDTTTLGKLVDAALSHSNLKQGESKADKVTSAEKKAREAQEKLNAWNAGKGIQR